MSTDEYFESLIDMEIAKNAEFYKFVSLGKYLQDPAFYERFMDDALYGDGQITREPPQPGYKTVADSEFQASALEYFVNHCDEMQTDYFDRLVDRIDEQKIIEFFDIIKTYWTDGHRSRNHSPGILGLKKAVYLYLAKKDQPIYSNEAALSEEIIPLLDIFEMESLLEITQNVTELYLENYLEQRVDYLESSLSGIYVHRGLSLKTELECAIYVDQGILNSYSLCVTVPEKFAQQGPKSIPAIVSVRYPEICDRVLVFAPLIPKMRVDQMELLLIPSIRHMRLNRLGCYGGILEYEMLDGRST